MTAHDLLIEIGTEELPPKQLQKLSMALGTKLTAGFAKANLSHGKIKLFVSPRRLGVYVQKLAAAQPSHLIEKRGPALAAAFNDGHPTLACLGFANACQTTVDALTIQETEKGAWLYFHREQPGETAAELLPGILQQALLQMPFTKPMRWGNHTTLFIRPVHWVVLLLGGDLIEATILNLPTSRYTFGHRFHHPDAIKIAYPSEYESQLGEQGWVITDFAKRKQTIRRQLEQLSSVHEQVLIDETLLDEVTGLVEWPVALRGEFPSAFLELPPEVIVTAMKQHQKYFSVQDEKGQLLPQFITVSNIASRDPQRVVAGNQRVLRARLADAQFFYHSDLKQTLESRLIALKNVLFQQKLGSLLDKSQRLAQLAYSLAATVGIDPDQAHRAGLLAKTDLITTMVGEFPELQGVMGYYYALNDHEPQPIALAIRAHYQPRFSGDTLPDTVLGCIISIADKIDTIVGLFGVNQPPTGEKDPFGLRRAAVGILRVCIEKQLPIDLMGLLTQAAGQLELGTALENVTAIHQAFEFIMERARAWYVDRGVEPDIFAAVLAIQPTQPLDFHYRIQALQHFQTLPEAKALTVAYKRVSRILKDQSGVWQQQAVNSNLLEHSAEQQLLTIIEHHHKTVTPLYQQKKYTEALTLLAALQAPIAAFFDEVMVMVDHEPLRHNRLALLYQLQQLFLQVADISLLPG